LYCVSAVLRVAATAGRLMNSVLRNSVPGNAWSSSFRTTVRTLRLYKHRRLFREAGAKRSARRAADRRRIGVSKRHRGGLERASGWYGIGAPKGTPIEIIEKLNKEINASLADPKLKARLADLGGDVLALSPADFGKLIAAEIEKWGKVIRAANIKAE
jgi:Tripartite tricarboxylate transporter family receptor